MVVWAQAVLVRRAPPQRAPIRALNTVESFYILKGYYDSEGSIKV